MDNVLEICTKWLMEARAQNDTESCEIEAGRMFIPIQDDLRYAG